MSQVQMPLLPDQAAKPERARRTHAVARDLPVAQVALLTPLPHLDRLFDYEVPEKLSAAAVEGARVRVRLAGRLVDGYILARTHTSQRDLQPLRSVHGPGVLTRDIAELCRQVADRYAGTLADVLRFAVPPRRARAESREQAPKPPAPAAGPAKHGVPVPEPAGAPDDPGGWPAYAGGPGLLHSIGRAEPVRALWVSAPGEGVPQRIAELVRAARLRGRGVLVIAPDATAVGAVADALAEAGIPAARLVAESGAETRYRTFLSIRSGRSPVVVGTRAAVFAPVADLGAIILWDDGDDSLAEPQAPGWHAREVLALRSTQAGAALVIGGPAVTLEAARMQRAGWLTPVEVPRAVLRQRAPRVQVAADLADDPARSGSRIPSVALQALRTAIDVGPVLISVPRAGYLPMLACRSCREPVGCPRCARPMQADGPDRRPVCRVHGVTGDWHCPLCGSTGVRAVVVGVRRTAEEFGRALPGVPVVMSSGPEPARGPVPGRTMVVATPGAEPVPGPGGYSAVVLLDTGAALSRPGLRVAEEVLRRWFAVSALVRPAAEGGRVLVVGDPELREVQALIRWDPRGYADRELAERTHLHLPPAVRVARVTGAPGPAQELVEAVTDQLGPTLLRRSGPLPAGEESVTWLLAVSIGDGARLSAAVQREQAARSLRRAPVVGVRLDPAVLG